MKLQPRPLTSSLGSKYVMAITGLLLTGFVLIHVAGNLLVYAGPDALNSYAHGLKSRPPLLWSARLGLLAVFVTHLVYAVRLRLQNAKARPIDYAYPATLQASWASRHMLLTGLVLLAFVVYHLAHFTLGVVKPAKTQYVDGRLVELSSAKDYNDLAERRLDDGSYVADKDLSLSEAEKANRKAKPGERTEVRHDVYSMVIAGFRNPLVSGSYVLAMVFLGLHLWHGGSSWLQSLGIAPPGYKKLLAGVGPAVALLVVIGNCSMPLYVMARYGVTF
jgi:succinate dehydrogenase / fumarate reductase cytochrome b subunit